MLISHYWYLSLRSGRGAPQVTGTKGPLIKQVAGRPMARAHALLSSTYFPLIYVWKYKEPDSSPGPRKGLCSVCHRKSSKQTRRQAFRSSTLMTPNLGWHCWIGIADCHLAWPLCCPCVAKVQGCANKAWDKLHTRSWNSSASLVAFILELSDTSRSGVTGVVGERVYPYL